MRPRSVALVVLAAACAGCFDLFHDTDWAARPDAGGAGATGSAGSAGAPSTGGSTGDGGSDGGSAAAATGGAGGSAGGAGGGAPIDPIGCSDGQREGYFDPAAFPLVASCSGAWSVAGVMGALAPVCGRLGGDDGQKPDGIGCSAADLCAEGWHVCASSAEVAAASPSGCGGAADPQTLVFFATGQSGAGLSDCGPGENDLFGCGTIGTAPAPTCAPLDRTSADLCAALGAPWSCGLDGAKEATAVTKTGSDGGGVLCCR
jgi:hypothetical protein